MITAEFDRQAALVARLRASHDDHEHDGIPFRGADFDPSPETAVFTVFFFAYCAVVGNDWQAYQRKGQSLLNSSADEAPSEAVFSNHSGRSKSSVVDTADDAEHVMEDEKKSDNDAFLLCDRDTLSGIIVSVPEMALNACDLCGIELSEKESLFMYSDKSEGHDLTSVANGPNLFEMDNDLLAEYEEAREIASAQLDLAFEALSTLASRGLPTDPDAFKSLMEACGRCGNTNRAIQLIRIMKRDGFVADSEIYSCFLSSFAQVETAAAKPMLEAASLSDSSRRSTDAYSAFLRKKLLQSRAANQNHSLRGSNTSVMHYDDDLSTMLSDSSISNASINIDSSLMSDIYNAVFTAKPKQRRKKKKRTPSIIQNRSAMPLTDGLAMQYALGESLLAYLKPDLVVDTSRNSCPQCSSTLTEDDIVAGWKPCEFQDFTSQCPQCKHLFIPHFTVTSSKPDFMGTQGKGTPLYCEFLSPWVLRKELEFVIHGTRGVEEMLDPEWRRGTDIRATLWWNLIVHFRRYHLPVAFLLQGSFHNRLINPTP
jgi:pentatricopeptide repeat protein